MKNIAVLASGNGSNFEAIVNARRRGNFKADIKILVTDKKNSFARKRARRLRIKDIFVNPAQFKTREKFDRAVAGVLRNEKIDIVLLAGYMRILSPYFVKKFKNRVINIHPSLLPAFGGIDSIRRAFEYGCKITGVTVHFVDESLDNGPVILQEAIPITPKTNLNALERKIHRLEHKLYPLAVKLVLSGRLCVRGRRVNVKPLIGPSKH